MTLLAARLTLRPSASLSLLLFVDIRCYKHVSLRCISICREFTDAYCKCISFASADALEPRVDTVEFICSFIIRVFGVQLVRFSTAAAAAGHKYPFSLSRMQFKMWSLGLAKGCGRATGSSIDVQRLEGYVFIPMMHFGPKSLVARKKWQNGWGQRGIQSPQNRREANATDSESVQCNSNSTKTTSYFTRTTRNRLPLFCYTHTHTRARVERTICNRQQFVIFVLLASVVSSYRAAASQKLHQPRCIVTPRKCICARWSEFD